jgi:AraC family transcriptional regulator of adaptative response / DNA-3-methyladenine glycosylase II
VARAAVLERLAHEVAEGRLTLQPGSDATETMRALAELGIDEGTAATIAMRALGWPDAFGADDPVLQRAAGVDGREALLGLAERWRPWRAYAALHLREGARSLGPRSRHPDDPAGLRRRARTRSLRSSPAGGSP